MARDPERAQAIENDVSRTLRFAADELTRSPDRTASMVERAAKQLESSDAKEHLQPETLERLLAEVAALRKQVEDSERAEKAQRIEREIKRYISTVEDEIRTSGSQPEQYLEKAVKRLASAEAQECLLPDSIDQLQQQIAELQAKLGVATPEPAKPAPPPAREPIAPTAQPAKVSTPPPVRPAVDSERARAIQNDVARLLRFAADEINAPGWRQAESYVERAVQRLESEETLQHLSTETLEQFRAQIAELQAGLAARDRDEHIASIQEQMSRLIGEAERNIERRDSAGNMLERAAEALESEDATTYLPAEMMEGYRRDIARIQAMIAGNQKQRALDAVTEPLEKLEELVVGLSFEGLDEYQTQKLGSELERFGTYAERAISELQPDEPQAAALRARLKTAQDQIASAWASTQRNRVAARVAGEWDETRKTIAGWEEETQDTGADALGGDLLPKTANALRHLRSMLGDNSRLSSITEARTNYANDKEMQGVIAEAERLAAATASKLAAAFDAIMEAAEQLPTPSIQRDREKATFMAQRASSVFEGTEFLEVRVARAKALFQKWEAAIEAERARYLAIYEELTAKAEAAWPAIASKIEAHEGFDPLEQKWRGKTIRLNAIRNRIGWDFGGPFDFAIWVDDTPVVGNFEPKIREAVAAAEDHTRNQIDDHTDWDAIIVVGGPGKVNQRFKMTVKKDGHEVGTIEEWRPVDCIMCDVIALRAGPVAVGR